MIAAALQNVEHRDVARPLTVLTPMIQRDVEEGDQAGKDHYIRAGEKLIEAKEGHFDGKASAFWRYAEKTTGKSKTTLNIWMAAAAVGSGKQFKSLRQLRQAPRSEGGLGVKDNKPVFRDWTSPVDEVVARVRQEAHRLQQMEIISHNQERDAQRKLAERLIDIGFRVLAKELHPDKLGGDKAAMMRLNTVRDKLKHSI